MSDGGYPDEQNEHEFGGPWTEEKLGVLRNYLKNYTLALKNQPFQKIYIDAFAGSGQRIDAGRRSLAEQANEYLFDNLRDEDAQTLFNGSAANALEIDPPFDGYIFIEKDPERCRKLEYLKQQFPLLESRIYVRNCEANSEIQRLCQKIKWHQTRAVLFLDPYGLQVDWDTIKAIAGTQSIDLWLLFPLSGLNRQLRKDGKIDEATRKRIDRLLGAEDWYEHIYEVSKQADLFSSQPTHRKVANVEGIGHFVLQRLQEIFPAVSSTLGILCNRQKSPLFLFCFAAANEKGGPIAKRIANHLLKGLG
ncbi:MAG: three-Cys-motif partner protein TcmP [Deltaproteobacteria bacterium]|nr:three-Cys-motif partner protein TcmP [Deltaproteobacteria bacterium]MCB9489832.1 three-Cys-motif partner protein TcmP [Deltaproteobacteria bacterium]